MKITDVRVKLINTDSKTKAFASVTIDDAIVLHNIRVADGKNGLFVSMPTREIKKADGSTEYLDIFHPISKEAREQLSNAILAAYNGVVENN